VVGLMALVAGAVLGCRWGGAGLVVQPFFAFAALAVG